MPNKSSIGVLVSGGLDSDVLLAELAAKYNKVWPIYVRQGLAWEEAELYWLKRFLSLIQRSRSAVIPAKAGTQNKNRLGPGFHRGDGIQPLTVLSLPMNDLYGAHWSTGRRPVPGSRTRDEAVYLPGRNLALSVKAAVFAAMNDIPALALGSLDNNPFPDAQPRFFKRWGDILGMGLGARLEVLAPFRRLTKREVIRRGRRFPLGLSFSCLAPQGRRHCGRCNKCAERRRAFKAAGVEDRTLYEKS